MGNVSVTTVLQESRAASIGLGAQGTHQVACWHRMCRSRERGAPLDAEGLRWMQLRLCPAFEPRAISPQPQL